MVRWFSLFSFGLQSCHFTSWLERWCTAWHLLQFANQRGHWKWVCKTDRVSVRRWQNELNCWQGIYHLLFCEKLLTERAALSFHSFNQKLVQTFKIETWTKGSKVEQKAVKLKQRVSLFFSSQTFSCSQSSKEGREGKKNHEQQSTVHVVHIII